MAKNIPAPFLDRRHPANGRVLASLRRGNRRERALAAPNSIPDPYMNAGSHPDVVERVWDGLGRRLPQNCRCLLYGTPALVHPVSGVVLAVCYGTEYALRIPRDAAAEARRLGARTVTAWTDGGRANIQRDFGRDWIFGAWLAQERAWCLAVYQTFEQGRVT
jgi:hypothetical protein